jgi:dipeptidyl aminopeptidase/acylaminoacyl peptidase
MRALFGFDSTNITDAARALLKENSPLTYVQRGLPPFLLINGSADKMVPLEMTRKFFEALKSANVDATLITIPKGQHRIADWNKFTPDWQQQLVAWLNEKLTAK